MAGRVTVNPRTREIVVGFFGTYLYEAAQQRWRPEMPAINDIRQPVRGDREPDAAEPWLLVDIHDSDFTVVTYRPVGQGTGVAYLGFTPRTYFDEDEDDSEVFVELKTGQFLVALGLPLPAELAR